jgi:hypothetical protein
MNRKGIDLGSIILLLAFSGTVLADDQFSAQSIRGDYGFSGFGTTLGQPAAVAGLTHFDGIGSCTTTAVINVGGARTPLTSSSCTYTVNANGTGLQKITFAGLGEFWSDFVIVDNTKGVHFALSDRFGGGTVASGIAQRQGGGRD